LIELNNYKNKLNECDSNNNKNNINKYSNNISNVLIEPLHKILKPNKGFNAELKAILCFPDKKYDSEILTKSFSIILDEKENIVNINNKSNEEYDELKISTKNRLLRPIIGFITSGGISYNKCKGVGKGFISMDALKVLMKLKQDLKLKNLMLLLRERDSRLYKLCNFKVISLIN